MNWKNISSYSQGDKVRLPKTFELRCAGLRLVVTRRIHCAADAWFLDCEPFAYYIKIGNGTAEEAQAAAVEYVRKSLEKAIAAMTPNAKFNGGCGWSTWQKLN